jgi:CHAT domain-containing protein
VGKQARFDAGQGAGRRWSSRREFYQVASFGKTFGKRMQRTLKATHPMDPVYQGTVSSRGRGKSLRLPLQIGVLAASLALAVFSLPQSPWYPGKLENRATRMKRQLSTTGKLPEAQLFGLPNAPPPLRKARPAGPGDDDIELSRLLGDLATEGSASSLHDRGLLQLLLGQSRAASEDLEKAAALAPESVELRNDLAVAQLARAEAEDDPRLLVHALQGIERARRAAPEDPRVLYNRALLLGRLYLVEPARRAWELYLATGEASAWQAHAEEEHRATLPVDPAAGLGKNVPAALERAAAAGDRPRVRRIAEQFPFETRRHAEGDLRGEPSLLGSWAESVKSGDASQAKRALDLLRELARVRLEKGDFLLAETVAAIEAAEAAGPANPRREAVVEGHLAYQRALAVMSSANWEIGTTELERAESRLATAGSPFRLWAKVQQALCLYEHEEYVRALDLLKQLAVEPGIDRYPSLRARALWLSGLVHTVQKAVALSRKEYGEAQRLYEKLGETPLVIQVGSALIFPLYAAGDELAAWRQGVKILRAASRSGDAGVRIKAFQVLAHFARQERDALAALLFLNEAIELGEGRGPLWVQGSLRMRGEVWADLQMKDLATRDWSRAAALAQRLEDLALRQSIENDLLELEARIVDPVQALHHLSLILDLDEEALDPYRRISALEERARAHQASGSDALAAADLEALLHLVESQELPEDHLLRQVLVDRGRDLYEELIRLDLDRGRPDLAFETAERWRAHRFEVAKASPRPPGLPPSLREVQQGLGDGEAVLAFLSLPDRLVAWWVTASQLEQVPMKLDGHDLATEVESFRGQVAIGSALELRVESRAVSTLLLRGLAEHLPEARHLLIVPDGPLWRLPFAALVNPATGRFLVEERSFSILPVLSSGRRSREAGFGDRTRTLALGNPAFDPEEFPTLEPLPYAEREAQEVARLFPRGKALLARSATKAALLAEIQNAELLHFSGHTLSDASDPWGSLLVLGPATTREGGIWTAREILAEPLSGLRLAVLASCRSGLSSRNDSEGSASLARAFLAAGAEQVVASLWNVEDREAARLLQDFYLALGDGKSPPQALQDAQVRALERGERTWAQFEVFGGGL